MTSNPLDLSQVIPVAKLAARMADLYLADPVKISKICDEQLDRSGALLGWLREIARGGTSA